MRSSGDEHHDVIRAIYDSGSVQRQRVLCLFLLLLKISGTRDLLNLVLGCLVSLIYTFTAVPHFFVVVPGTQASVYLSSLSAFCVVGVPIIAA